MTTTITNCRWCGMTHGIRCPSVKAIEYFGDGVTVKRIEFMVASDYHPVTLGLQHQQLPPFLPFHASTTWGGDNVPKAS